MFDMRHNYCQHDPNARKFLMAGISCWWHSTWLNQCSWISWDSASEPIDCSTPLATSFMPFHGIVYCLSYYPSCAKVNDQCNDYYRQIPGQENVSMDHTVHVIVVADRLRRRPGIHRIQHYSMLVFMMFSLLRCTVRSVKSPNQDTYHNITDS